MFGENINNVNKSTETLLAASKKFVLEGNCEKLKCVYIHVSLAECRSKACHKDS